jgi:hypothetical protein
MQSKPKFEIMKAGPKGSAFLIENLSTDPPASRPGETAGFCISHLKGRKFIFYHFTALVQGGCPTPKL